MCIFRCPDGTLAKSCKTSVVLKRTGSEGMPLLRDSCSVVVVEVVWSGLHFKGFFQGQIMFKILAHKISKRQVCPKISVFVCQPKPSLTGLMGWFSEKRGAVRLKTAICTGGVSLSTLIFLYHRMIHSASFIWLRCFSSRSFMEHVETSGRRVLQSV